MTNTLLEEMVLFRTRNGSIPRFIQYMELQNGSTIFLVKGSIGQVWNPRVLYRTQRNPFLRVYRTFRGSKYVALTEPFKVLYRTFSSKSVLSYLCGK